MRNLQTHQATSEYVLFLDPSGEFEPGGIEALIEAIEQYGDDVDLFCFPATYVDESTGNEQRFGYDKQFAETGIYSLAELPSFCQTAMNICVKRELALKHPFPSSAIGAEKLFATTILVQKGVIGYCRQAAYRCIVKSADTPEHQRQPVYVFAQMIEFYSQILALAELYPKSREYCNQVILRDFGQRLAIGTLFPEFGDSRERRANAAELERIATTIPAASYFNSKHLRAPQKLYLLRRFKMLPNDLSFSYEGVTATAYSDGEAIWKTKTPAIRITRCLNQNSQLYVFGILEGPIFSIDKRTPSLAVTYGKETLTPELKPSSFEYSNAHEKTTRAWYFELTLSVPGKETEARFSLKLSDEVVRLSKITPNFSRTNSRIGNSPSTRYFEHCTVKVKKESMVISPVKPVGTAHALIRDHRIDPSLSAIRRRARRLKKRLNEKQVWLYSDLPTSLTKGNAIAQILHDLEKNDNVCRFYVTNHPGEIAVEYPALEEHLLEYRSEDHLCYYLAADAILASYLDLPTFTPCDRKVFDKLGDLSKCKTMVYLQHGILHAHMPWYFSYDRKLFDFEVISTTFEENNLVSNYYFPRDRLIDAGAPKLDSLMRSSRKERKIIYAPSWRSHLVKGGACQRISIDDAFLNSSFYKGMVAFIKQIERSELLEKHGYTFELKLHPNLAMYKEHLVFDDPRISMAPEIVDEGIYDVMITDYSSYVYDFLFAGSRILYYLPDQREFEGGANHYSRLDLPIQKGFGGFSNNPDDAVKQLDNLLTCLENGTDDPHLDAWKQREMFFLHTDGLNAERLYEYVSKIVESSSPV